MKKDTKVLLIVGVLVVAGYLAFRWYQNYKANQPGGGQLGTNLNSIAPELVGGSQGPTAQPAFNVPVSINVSTSESAPQTPDKGSTGDSDSMISANPTGSYGGSTNALMVQSDAAGQDQSMMPTGDYAAQSPYAGQGGAG